MTITPTHHCLPRGGPQAPPQGRHQNDGTGLQQRTSGPAQELDADWAPTGDAVAYAILGGPNQPNGFATLRLAAGAQPGFIAIAQGDYVRWSPDGKSILYHGPDALRARRLDTGADSLFVSNAADSAEAFYIAFGPDGKSLYYLARSAHGWSIRSKPMTGGGSELLVDFNDPARQHTRYGFTTDGKVFYFTLGSPESDIRVADMSKP